MAKLNSTATSRAAPKHNQSHGLKLHRPIAVIDLETTGTSVDADQIVEIGILKVMPDGGIHRFRKRVRPGIRIPREATQVHGITNADVASKPRFKTIARDVSKFIRHCDLAGFNLKSFDLLMLQTEFERAGLDFSCDDRHVIDVKEIYHLHEKRTLCDAVTFYCKSTHDEAHSALEDAIATWRVLEAQIPKYGLPRSVRRLAEFLEQARPSRFLDSGRWFTTRDGKDVFAKGKYNGVSLSRIAREDPDYLQWILGLPDVPEDTKRMIQEATQE
jgi:DNA polymerase-3 subunit epsilon